MPDGATTHGVSLKGLAILLVKGHHLHEGVWQLWFRFGPQAGMSANINGHLWPSLIVHITEVGLQRVATVYDIAVDAAVVNPLVLVTEGTIQ